MPRLTVQFPKYRRYKPTNQAFVELAGHRYYLGPYRSAASRTLYDAFIQRWLAGGRQLSVDDVNELTGQLACQEGNPTAVSFTVTELANRYVAHAEQYYRKQGCPTREAGQVEDALEVAVDLFGGQPAEAFGGNSLERVRDEMIRRDWSRGHINRQIARIKRAWRWAVSKELIAESPKVRSMLQLTDLAKGRSKARETAPVEVVDDALVEATLPFLQPAVADMIRVQRLTGMRPHEVCQLRWDRIDETGEVWLFSPEQHKNEHHEQTRLVPLGPQCQLILSHYAKHQGYIFSPKRSEAQRLARRAKQRKTPLSCGNTRGSNRVPKPRRTAGSKYTKDSYGRAVRRACDKGQLARWSPNQLRHTAATEIRKQFGLEGSQVILGHARADVTQVYAERNQELAVRIAREVG